MSVKDSRDTEADWLGAIRGGFGQPLKTLLADRPVKEVVQNAFLDALKARGMLTEAGAGTLELAVDVRKFDCSQYVRREGHAIFAISVIDLGTRQSSFDKTVRVDRTVGDTAAFDAGIFASVEDLRVVAKDTLKEAIDDALDDPQLRSALGQS